MADKAEKAIRLGGQPKYHTKRFHIALMTNKDERATMRKVMRETNGEGGPWFEHYTKSQGLL